jgi:HEPN domain-containing protein
MELRQLAEERLLDAAALLAARRWAGAYYLAGHAVECGLKACIARLTNAEDFPPKVKVVQDWLHT